MALPTPRHRVDPLDQAKWRDLAACKGSGPSVFFGPSTAGARARCRRCVVQEICFWYALATEEESGYRFGVWGATTPALRRHIAALIGDGYAWRRLNELLESRADARLEEMAEGA
jgi:hypothetical protein